MTDSSTKRNEGTDDVVEQQTLAAFDSDTDDEADVSITDLASVVNRQADILQQLADRIDEGQQPSAGEREGDTPEEEAPEHVGWAFQ